MVPLLRFMVQISYCCLTSRLSMVLFLGHGLSPPFFLLENGFGLFFYKNFNFQEVSSITRVWGRIFPSFCFMLFLICMWDCILCVNDDFILLVYFLLVILDLVCLYQVIYAFKILELR